MQNELIRKRLRVKNEILDEASNLIFKRINDKDTFKSDIFLEQINFEDCRSFVNQLIEDRNTKGFLLEKSVVNDGLAKIFPDIEFEESSPELDHAGDIDYIGKVGEKAFGIQIKPITASSNFGNYNISERMNHSFHDFEEKFGGKVFVVFSSRVGNRKDIINKNVVEEIKVEIERLRRIK